MALFKSPEISVSKVESILDSVVDPHTSKGLVSSGRISGLTVRSGGEVLFVVETLAEAVAEGETLRAEAESAVRRMKGVKKVTAVLTAEHGRSDAPQQPPKPADALPGMTQRRVRKGARLSDEANAQSQTRKSEIAPIPGIKNIVAVASAKGGVGKSSIATNLAIALSQLGLRVGLLDADVYGPSIPTMMGKADAQPQSTPDKKLLPVEVHGLKTMSIGYVSDVDAPMIWRGPMVMSAINQMLNDVKWGELDILLIDTPPGTGDAQLTLAQRVPLSGVVIVSTPQEVALADVRRGVAMFRKTEVPVLGIIENMAYFQAPGSDEKSYIFGEGGARKTAEAQNVPFLGEVPLLQAVREGGDAGKPYALQTPGSVFADIAASVMEALKDQTLKPAPEIVFE